MCCEEADQKDLSRAQVSRWAKWKSVAIRAEVPDSRIKTIPLLKYRRCVATSRDFAKRAQARPSKRVAAITVQILGQILDSAEARQVLDTVSVLILRFELSSNRFTP